MAVTTGNRVDRSGNYQYWAFGGAVAEACTVTLPAPGGNKFWILDALYFGYNANPAAGVFVTVAVGGTTVFSVPILAGGMNTVEFQDPIIAANNAAVVVTIPSDAGATGRMNVMARQDEQP